MVSKLTHIIYMSNYALTWELLSDCEANAETSKTLVMSGRSHRTLIHHYNYYY